MIEAHTEKQTMSNVVAQPALLLRDYQHLFKPNQGQVLDLACGKGQNGLYLKQYNISLLFADINPAHLATLMNEIGIEPSACWQADFESETKQDALKLSNMQLQGAIVFRYLHRPLFEALKASIKPGGVIIYETFIEENKQFGRPHRAEFLLKKNELNTLFNDWETLFYFEGIKHNPDRAIAQIVCRKPVI